MKRILLLFIFSIPFVVFSQTYSTVAPGDWNSPSTWQNGNVPAYSFDDTVLINHRITFDSIISCQGYFKIDERGGICGHHLLNIYGEMDVYGFYWADSVDVFGGDVFQSSAYQCRSTRGIHIHGAGASYHNQGGAGLHSGGTFDCGTEFMTVAQQELTADFDLKLYPNPTSDFIILSGFPEECDFILLDHLGKMVLKGKANSKITLSSFEQGFYFFLVFQHGKCILIEKIIKE